MFRKYFSQAVIIASTLVSRKQFSSSFSMSFKRIGTHNGTFHCDEALGCYMLKLLNRDAEIVRSRDEKVLETCDIVIDVGGVFDPSKHRYDHHQREFNHTMKSLKPDMPYDIKLSSAGLVYCFFGKQIIRKIVDVDDEVVDALYKQVYERFIMEVDGVDNGVSMFDGEPRYSIRTGVSARVGHLNEQWNEKDFDENAAFSKAVELVGGEFRVCVERSATVWWPARALVKEAIEKRLEVHENGQLIKLDKFVPWMDHLFQLEKEMKIEPSIKFVLYNDNSMWRIRAVPISLSSFLLRVPLYKEWRGLRSEQLTNCEVPNINFVHTTGFIGGNDKLEGAIQMGLKSLDANPDEH